MLRQRATVFLFAAALTAAMRGQSGPQFEAVSIRPSPPHYGPIGAPSLFSGGPGSSDPGRLTISHFSVENLIIRAYNLTRAVKFAGLDQIPLSDRVPLPWIEVENFDVVAKVPAGASPEDLGPMLQNMLAERLGLKVHFEKKEMPIYKLVVAKAGPKPQKGSGLVPSSTIPDPGESEPLKPFTLPPGGGGAPFQADQNGFPIIPKGSVVTGAGLGGRRRQLWHKETMGKLADFLSGLPTVGRVVRDATGLQDEYDFSLYWAQEEIVYTNGVRVPPPAEPIGGPSMFEALEKQLGLKLEPSRGPVDFLVIDHIDRTPSEN